jgi:hypothetical protein
LLPQGTPLQAAQPRQIASPQPLSFARGFYITINTW